MDPTHRHPAAPLAAGRPPAALLSAQTLSAQTLSAQMPSARTLSGLALSGLLLSTLTVFAALLLTATPARAGDVFVQVNPSTVEAGFLVGIKASCTDNTMPATVDSPAFGTVTVQPQGGQLTAAAMVPAQTKAGSYRVRLDCPDGRNATTNLNVVNAGRPTRGPATGFGGSADGDGMDGLLIGGGVAVTALGAGLGLIALRRRVAPAGGAPAGGTSRRRRTRS